MYKNCCNKCGSTDLFTKMRGTQTGLYCSDCGSWIKWIGKDELVAFHHSVDSQKQKCEYCEGAKALVIGETDDKGIALKYPNMLHAYGYDVHGFGSNGLTARIKYCPMCGKQLKQS